MNRVEDLGFSVMASYEAKLTMVEGVFLGAGAAIACVAAYQASRSLAERAPTKKAIQEMVKKLEASPKIASILVTSHPFRAKDCLRGAAQFALETGASVQNVENLFEANGEEFLRQDFPLVMLSKKQRVALKNLSGMSKDKLSDFLNTIKDGVRDAAFQASEWKILTDLIGKKTTERLVDEDGKVVLREGVIIDQEDISNIPFRLLSKVPVEGREEIIAKRIDEVIDDLRKSRTDTAIWLPMLERLEIFADFDDDMVWRYGESIGYLTSITSSMTIHDLIRSGLELRNEDVIQKNFPETQWDDLSRALGDADIPWKQDPGALTDLKSIVEERGLEDAFRLLTLVWTHEDLKGAASLQGIPLDPRASGSDYFDPYDLNSGFQYGATDWDQYRRNLIDFHKIPLKLYKDAQIPKRYMLKISKRAEKSDEIKKAIFLSAAIHESIDSPNLDEFISKKWARMLDHSGDDSPVLTSFDELSKAFKSGVLKKFNDVCFGKSNWWYGQKIRTLLDNLDEIKDFNSCGQISEQLDVLAGLGHGDDSQRTMRSYTREEKIARRMRDKLARRDPAWAISEYPSEYKRGRRIAKLLEQLVDHVESIVRRGDTVVVHGRDGELLYDLLMRRPGIDRSKVKYAITSRPVTTFALTTPVTEHHRKELQRYYDYLSRTVPTGAVHVDTGFEGSIPRWLDNQGFEVKAIKMVSANRPEEEIPINLPVSREERRDIVLSDLEHSSQRLDTLERYDPKTEAGGFGGIVYSLAAPGYHARAYGVYDELGLPRLKGMTPKTRFEEKRLRIASRPSEEDEASLEAKDALALK